MNDGFDIDDAPILLHEVYTYEFRVHAITLIVLGYRRLSIASLSTAEEDDITGELVRNIRLVATDPKSPVWVDRYEVREQVPQNVAGVRGKRRPRMDIEVERHYRGPRPCIGFEAKRLGRGKRLNAYLGTDGLGAFLSGHYPTTHGEAGMLGYVQENSVEHWSGNLARELARGQYQVSAGGEMRTLMTVSEMPLFFSEHTDSHGKPLSVIHLLLSFAPPVS